MNIGDTVKLKSVKRREATTATIIRIVAHDNCLLDKRLAGFQWWNADDLVVVRSSSTGTDR